jgi:glycosyltransferase involved in cell wall biosynthesis
MLIVHLITGLQCGGAEDQLQQLVLASDSRRFRHIVISLLEGGPIASELKAAGIEVYSLGMRRGLPSPAGMVRLVRLLRRLKPEVLHCWLYHACLMGLLGARLAGVPRMIWGLHSANPGLRGYSLSTRAVVRLCAKFSSLPDSIVVVSERCWIAHRQLGYETARMRIIANGVDVQRFSPDVPARKAVREEFGLTDNSILVGLFARYSPMKDHATFLRAAELVHRRCPEVRFLLAGRGITVDNQTLLQLVRDSSLQDVACLLGPRRDVSRLTAALDIACLSSWSESFGSVVVEAMACEVPCVATNVGDLASIVENTGRVVPPSDPSALAEAMIALIAMHPAERAALGQRARQRVLAHFTLEKTVSAYEDVYDKSSVERNAEVSQTMARSER